MYIVLAKSFLHGYSGHWKPGSAGPPIWWQLCWLWKFALDELSSLSENVSQLQHTCFRWQVIFLQNDIRMIQSKEIDVITNALKLEYFVQGATLREPSSQLKPLLFLALLPLSWHMLRNWVSGAEETENIMTKDGTFQKRELLPVLPGELWMRKDIRRRFIEQFSLNHKNN